jgi:hypothetical protein
MKTLSREDRLNRIVTLFENVPDVISLFTRLYTIVCKYDVPKHVDREFAYDSLITYFSSLEDYSKCAVLKKLKNSSNRQDEISFDFNDLSIGDLEDLKSTGYTIPDYITIQVYTKNN